MTQFVAGTIFWVGLVILIVISAHSALAAHRRRTELLAELESAKRRSAELEQALGGSTNVVQLPRATCTCGWKYPKGMDYLLHITGAENISEVKSVRLHLDFACPECERAHEITFMKGTLVSKS